MKLHHKILIHSLLGHILVVSLVGLIIFFGTLSLLERELYKLSESEARGIFHSLYQGMLKGYHKEELNAFIEGFQGEGKEVRLYRRQDIPRGMLESLREGFHYVKKDRQLSFMYLLKADERCIKCHFKSKIGDVLGLLEINLSIEETRSYVLKLLLFTFVFVTLAILGGILFIGNRQAKYITNFIQSLYNRLEKAQNIDDLADEKFIFELPRTNIEEFDRFAFLLVDFVKKVQNLAIDRNVFEFETKLLERLILTSELIRDWRSQVLKLLEELNCLVNAPMLFSCFCNECGSKLEVEIFWHENPSLKVKETIEESLKCLIGEKFYDYKKLEFHHHVVFIDREFNQDLKQFKLKDLFLDQPKISGIIGVGLGAIKLTPSQEVAIDAVLSVLLNILGSAKAISKYIEDIEYYTTYDPITNLFNQRVFQALLSNQVELARKGEESFALLLINLDNFRLINNIYGHSFGDYFLQRVAMKLETLKEEGSILARLAGDEFVLLLPRCDLNSAYEVAKRVKESLANLKVEAPDQREVSTTATIALVVYPDHAENSQDLLSLLHYLMKQAKASGKDTLVVPTSAEIIHYHKEEQRIGIRIMEALDEDGIIPYFQPIYNLRTGEVFGVELLMRLKHKGELIPAYKFIPVAEKLGLLTQMDYQCVKKGLTQLKSLNFQGEVFINLSPKLIFVSSYVENLIGFVKDIDFPPENIVFELTERETVKNISLLVDLINSLSKQGFKFCIDDFGSGFSSYHYIKHFKVDLIKLEGEFVAGLVKREKVDEAIVESILTLAKRLSIRIIAESIENAEILEIVRELGVEYGQGYFLGKPSPEPRFPNLKF